MTNAFLAPSLVQLRDELTRRWPKRKLPDGWIGDAAHSARLSQHNPDFDDPRDPGIVRALDIYIDGINVQQVLDELIGDPRVWYVIHNGWTWSRTYGFRKLKYTGPNKHPHHIHVSIRLDYSSAHNIAAWFTVTATRAGRKLPHEQAWGANRLFVLDVHRRGPRADAVNAFLGLGSDQFTEKTKAAAAKFQRQQGTWRKDGRVGYGTYRLMAKESKRRAAG